MNRRSFLTLLLATPAVPLIARLRDTLALPVVSPPLHWVEIYTMSVSCGLVEPGAFELISVQPQRSFQPERLLIASQSEEFELLHVDAGGEPQLESALPAALFSPVAFGSSLAWDVVTPGQEIVLAVQNRGRERARFIATFCGKAAVS